VCPRSRKNEPEGGFLLKTDTLEWNIMIENSTEHAAIPFLKSLYRNCGQGSINLRFLPSGKNLFLPLSEIDSRKLRRTWILLGAEEEIPFLP
jgi:hypothetical protein